MNSKAEAQRDMGALRRLLGLVILAGVHIFLLVWSCVVAVVVPRYRKICRFQVRYFMDVMGNELRCKRRAIK